MSDFSEILSRELLRLKQDVGDQMAANDQIATGKTLARVREVVAPNLGLLLGPSHVRYLRDGRGPGGVSVQAIREWIQAKRLKLNPFAVAKRISELGTLLYRGEDPRFQKPTDTFQAPITAALPRLRAALTEAARTGLKSEIATTLPRKL